MISLIIEATCSTADTIRVIDAPALSTRSEPSFTLLTESSIKPLISCAAAALRCASVRTSLATTAKPRPCSPARAASTAAFSARILVWKAMPSITPIISTILRELSEIPCIVDTTLPTTSPPCVATSEAFIAMRLASRAFSALLRTASVNSSMLAEVSSSDDACCSVRPERSILPVAISVAPTVIESVARRTSDTITRS